MRILVHDYSGHPFQVELSSELARRGHDVTHSWCEAYVSGKGNLRDPASRAVFEPIGEGEVVDKLAFKKRIVQEVRFGLQLCRQVRRRRPDVVLVANAPIPTLTLLAAYLWVVRVPWVLWHQDLQGIAIGSFAGAKLGRSFRLVARAIGVAERWCARRAAGIVVISDAFIDVHRRWGTADRLTVVPNWAPIHEIVPVARDNAWARDHDLVGVPTLLYSGTLGLKHNPALLVDLAARVRDRGVPARLVVVTEGPAVDVLRGAADRAGVPLVLEPFQPYERLSEVLGTGDVLVVLLDASAGEFSVPSKTLSYLCAGRPVVGLMPPENLAAGLVEDAGGCVVAPLPERLDEAATWVVSMLGVPSAYAAVSAGSRALAEREFALSGSADRFEEVLLGTSRHARHVSTL